MKKIASLFLARDMMIGKSFFALLFLFVTALPSLAAPTNTTGPWGIDAGGFKNLSTALASPSTAGKTVVVSKPMSINNTTTNRTISVTDGGMINVNAGKIFTPTGSIVAGDYQIFGGDGSVSLLETRAHWHGAKGDGVTDADTAAVNKAIAAVTAGVLARYAPAPHPYASAAVIHFKTGTYLIGALDDITEAITFDFNRSKIIPNTTGVMFTIRQQSTADPYHVVGASDRVILKDAVVYGAEALHPTSVVKVLYHGYYALLENFHIRLVTATDALIYHFSGEGMTLRDCNFSDNNSASVFSSITVPGDALVQSNALLLDHILIQDQTGTGIYVNGGDISITNKSVIQGCTEGGIVHGGESTANYISVSDSYFENNGGYGSIDAVGRYGSGGNHISVKSSFFGSLAAGTSHIVVGAKTNITVQDCTFDTAGVGGAAPALNYVGINNKQQTATTGYTAGPMIELADNIRASNNIVIIKDGKSISRGGSLGSPTSGVPFTAFTSTEGTYLVTVHMTGGGPTFVASAIVFNDGINAMLLNYANGLNIAITLSGLDVQFTQTSGIPNSVEWSMIKL